MLGKNYCRYTYIFILGIYHSLPLSSGVLSLFCINCIISHKCVEFKAVLQHNTYKFSRPSLYPKTSYFLYCSGGFPFPFSVFTHCWGGTILKQIENFDAKVSRNTQAILAIRSRRDFWYNLLKHPTFISQEIKTQKSL